MKILSFNWHTPYLSMLARLDHSFEIAPPSIDSPAVNSWDEHMRPLTPNVTPITREETQQRLAEDGYYDLILAHNVKDIVATLQLNIPKILVFHNKLSTEAQLGAKPEVVDDYREKVRQLTSDVHCVFISQAKMDDWGLQGEIIMPGIDGSLYGGYTGEIKRALRVGNSIKPRDLMTGYSLQEKALEGLPNILMGVNPDIPLSVPSKGWDDLKKAYRENRLFLNTAMPPWEDGYNFGLLEAMATGTPVVSIANPTSPITDSVDGFVCETANKMRERVVELLDNIDLAKKIGEEGRLMVERKFPMSAFLEKWENAIQHAVTERAEVSGVVVKAKRPQPKPDGKNIVLSYTSYPATAGAYIEKALREKHSVLTAGCKLTPYIIDRWNLHNMKAEAHKHDIHTPELTVNIDYMRERMPDEFEPDFLLWVETGLGKAPEGLAKLDYPKAAYLIDTHLHFDQHLETAKKFDVVFIAQRAYIPQFKDGGVKNVFWLPLACDPDTHGKAEFEKEFDLGFVGSLTDERRVALLQRLAEKVNVRYDRLFLREMTDFFCKSKLVFNNAIKNDLNMRVFEALCCGSMLLTDDADGLGDFFTDREHLVIYNDDNIAELAEYYINHEQERERIAEAGRKLALEKHTYAHRMDEIVRVMGEFL